MSTSCQEGPSSTSVLMVWPLFCTKREHPWFKHLALARVGNLTKSEPGLLGKGRGSSWVLCCKPWFVWDKLPWLVHCLWLWGEQLLLLGCQQQRAAKPLSLKLAVLWCQWVPADPGRTWPQEVPHCSKLCWRNFGAWAPKTGRGSRAGEARDCAAVLGGGRRHSLPCASSHPAGELPEHMAPPTASTPQRKNAKSKKPEILRAGMLQLT